MSAFEATQPQGDAQLAGLKILVKSGCVLVALFVLSVSFWASASLLGDAVFIQMWNVPLASRLPLIKGAIVALGAYEQLSLAIVAAVTVVILVGSFAVIGALRARYSRLVNIAASSLLLLGFALALLGLGERNGFVSPSVVDAIFAAARWIFLAAAIFTTVYVLRNGFAERVLTGRYAMGAALISAAFGAAWLTTLQVAGVQLARVPAMHYDAVLLPTLLLPLLSILAPWSLNRMRHM